MPETAWDIQPNYELQSCVPIVQKADYLIDKLKDPVY